MSTGYRGYPEHSLYKELLLCPHQQLHPHRQPRPRPGRDGTGPLPQAEPGAVLGRGQCSAAPARATPASLQLTEHRLQRAGRLPGQPASLRGSGPKKRLRGCNWTGQQAQLVFLPPVGSDQTRLFLAYVPGLPSGRNLSA
ncbi:uncharacterized protein LJ264_007557 isoform 1-T1 [Porphyrio hochstetteri]